MSADASELHPRTRKKDNLNGRGEGDFGTVLGGEKTILRSGRLKMNLIHNKKRRESRHRKTLD